MFEIGSIQNQLLVILERIQSSLLIWENLLQLGLLGVLIFATRHLEQVLKGHLRDLIPELKAPLLQKMRYTAGVLSYHLVLCISLWAFVLIFLGIGVELQILHIAASLLTAWIVIRFLSSFLKNRTLARFFSFFIWAVTAFRIVNVYDEIVALLDSIAVSTGELRISILMVINGTLLLCIFLTAAKELTHLFDKKITSFEDLTPSVQVLIKKIFKITVFSVAILIVLGSLGIDLTAFAVLGGTIGLGIGFGLQRVVANFVSGIIILIDKSIKPGDIIEIGEVYGGITALGSRFVSVVTREGKEHLIPNEDFITSQVINWSYSDRKIRVKAQVGVSYGSDVKEVMEIMLKTADRVERVLSDPEPACFLAGFGDNSIDLVLNFWIRDPENGVANVRSQVLLAIWEEFKEHEIEIPFPQRDLHIKTEEAGITRKDLRQTQVAAAIDEQE